MEPSPSTKTTKTPSFGQCWYCLDYIEPGEDSEQLSAPNGMQVRCHAGYCAHQQRLKFESR